MTSFAKIEACANDVREWMYENKLKLNDDKTVFMILGNRPHIDELVFDSVIIGESYIPSGGCRCPLSMKYDLAKKLSMTYDLGKKLGMKYDL